MSFLFPSVAPFAARLLFLGRSFFPRSSFRIRSADQVARPRAKPRCSRCISNVRGRDTFGSDTPRGANGPMLIAGVSPRIQGNPMRRQLTGTGARNSNDPAPLFPSRRESWNAGSVEAGNGTRYSRCRKRDPVRSVVPVRAMESSSCAGNGFEIVVVGDDCHGTKTKTEDTRVAAPTRVHPPRAAHARLTRHREHAVRHAHVQPRTHTHTAV